METDEKLEWLMAYILTGFFYIAIVSMGIANLVGGYLCFSEGISEHSISKIVVGLFYMIAMLSCLIWYFWGEGKDEIQE